MILSSITGRLAREFGDKKAIEYLAQVGYDAYDYSAHLYKQVEGNPLMQDNYKGYIRELKETADRVGIVCNQAHAPFPSEKYGDEEFNRTMFQMIVRSMECAALLGAKIIVVHPIQNVPEEVGEMEYNIKFYNRLLPYCKKFGIKVALENMWKRDLKRDYIIKGSCGYAEEFARYLDALDPEWFVSCLDLGHTVLVGEEPQDAIRILGKDRLKALHVHDNDYRHDTHTLPYMGSIDWDAILKALAKIDYDGEFTYEADPFMSGFPTDFKVEAAAFMCKVGRYLTQRLEEYRQDNQASIK